MDKIYIAIIGISIIFLMTTLGSALVFVFKKDLNAKFQKIFLGFASGVMIAASIWSLLLPSIEQAKQLSMISWLPAAIGFLVGGGFLFLLDKIIPHFHKETNQEEGPKSNLKRGTKLFLAVTLHNIPEGLAVGLAFGAALNVSGDAAIMSALGLAVGIGLQNFPEGAALSLPMKEETGSRKKGFLYGMLSGVVEPIAAVIGILLASHITTLMPWALAFAAGAMIFVVAEELIPESQCEKTSHVATWGLMIGFVLMMVLDVALG